MAVVPYTGGPSGLQIIGLMQVGSHNKCQTAVRQLYNSRTTVVQQPYGSYTTIIVKNLLEKSVAQASRLRCNGETFAQRKLKLALG